MAEDSSFCELLGYLPPGPRPHDTSGLRDTVFLGDRAVRRETDPDATAENGLNHAVDGVSGGTGRSEDHRRSW